MEWVGGEQCGYSTDYTGAFYTAGLRSGATYNNELMSRRVGLGLFAWC